MALYAPDTKCDESDKIWFRFTLNTSASVVLKIYNNSGTLVQTLTCGTLEIGDYTSRQKAVLWDRLDSGGLRVSSGIYFVRLFLGGSDKGLFKFTLR